MPDDPYIAGLRAAEAALWARNKRHAADAKLERRNSESAIWCLTNALEAAECAAEIGRLITARERSADA